MSKALIFCLKDDTRAIFIIYHFMKYQTYDELKEFAAEKLKIENPCLKPNAKNIGIWLKRNGYIKVRIQVNQERKIYYYNLRSG